MPKYKIDVKHTYTIEAENLEKAQERLSDIVDEGIIDVDILSFNEDIISIEEMEN